MAGENIKLKEEAMSEILVADTDTESGAEPSEDEDDSEEEKKGRRNSSSSSEPWQKPNLRLAVSLGRR
jgi:hypothetical protein